MMTVPENNYNTNIFPENNKTSLSSKVFIILSSVKSSYNI